MATLLATARCLLELGPLRDSALPLSGRRVLLASPRTEAAPLGFALMQAGCRPIWCPGVRMEPLDDYSALDDALMRLTEYDVLILLSRHSIDAVAQRWLSLADGSIDVVKAMLGASSIEIGVIGSDARHLRGRLGVSPNVVPIEPAARALAATLRDLGHVEPGARVLVCTGQWSDADAHPAMAASCLQQLREGAAEIDCVVTHAILANGNEDALEPELGLLRSGAVDALCAGSAEELQAIAAACAAGTAASVAAWPEVLIALGEETAACARELAPEAAVIELGCSPDNAAVVEALEAHFGGGKLMF